MNVKKSEFVVRFMIALIWTLLFLYLGIFIKVYIFDVLNEVSDLQFKLKWIYASAISCGPPIILYVCELLKEVKKSSMNLSSKQEMFQNFINLYVNKSLSDNQILQLIPQPRQVKPDDSPRKDLNDSVKQLIRSEDKQTIMIKEYRIKASKDLFSNH